VRTPLLNANIACHTCPQQSEEELTQRVFAIQDRTFEMRTLAIDATLELTRAIGAAVQRDSTGAGIAEARQYQRQAQFYTDFVEAENSMGFHADQESVRILGKAIDFARRGQMALRGETPTTGTEEPPRPPQTVSPPAMD